MNKYHIILDRILREGKIQANKKGNIKYGSSGNWSDEYIAL